MKQMNRALTTITAMFTLLAMSTAALAPDMTGSLGARRYEDFKWTVSAGDWQISGFAKSGDLDIEVYDANGKLVDYDDDDDNTPVVHIVAHRRSEMTIRYINASHNDSLYFSGYLEEE